MYHAPESSPTPSHQSLSLCVNNRNDHFYFFHIYIHNHFHNHALLFWVVHFWCHTARSTNPDTFTAFHRWGLCLTIIDGSFTLREDISQLVDTQHNLSFTISLNRTTHLDVVPLIESTRSTPNAMLINNRVPTTHHRTPNTMSIYRSCTHTHLM